MAGSIMDLISAAAGHPDPSIAIARALGQMPGQPGSAQGPQPLAGPQPSAGPPGGPAGPGGPPGASGGPPAQQQQQQAPPQPQVYQTPPDLGSMFVQLMQHQQANEQFNRGMGMLAAGFANPRDRATMIDAMSGQSGDAGGLMGNLMRLQQFSVQQQRMADMQKNLPAIADAMGLPLSAVQTMYASNPETFGSEIAKIQEAQMGLTGDPVQRELSQSRREWMKENPGKTEADMIAAKPELAGPVEFQAGRTAATTEAASRTKDLSADKANFAPAKSAYDQMIADSEALLKNPGLNDIVGGWANQHKTDQTPGLASTTQGALSLYNKIMGNQYAAGVQDFKGAGRITQQELKQDLPGQSTMANRAQSPDDFRSGVQAYIDKLKLKRAQLFGAAGQLDHPDLTDEDFGKINPIYKPGGDLYAPGQAPRRAAAPSGAAAPTAENAGLKPMPDDTRAAAQALLAKDPSQRDALIAHLRQQGIDPTGL
jgi:hypothetical protein